MKNKRLIYILAPLVIFIWGLIFYEILSHKDNERQNDEGNVEIKIDKKSQLKDTFIVLANYRDPFLNNAIKSEKQTTVETVKLLNNPSGFTKKPDLSITPITFPDIQYFGLITNQKNKQKVGLFKMNNKDFIWKEGGLYEDIKISLLFNDSVCIIYRNAKRIYKKNFNKS